MRCIAYRASTNCIHAWNPCKSRAEKNSVFCRSHLKAICGVYLGLCVRGFPERMSSRNSCERPAASNAKTS